MIEAKEKYSRRKFLENNLRKSYATAYKDPKFKALVNNLKIKEDIAMKYTSSLENTVCELKNCENCEGLMYCKNKMEGFIYFPKENNERLEFSYVACKYKKKALKNEEKKRTSDIEKASFKEIDIDDKKRHKAIKWLKDFYKNYDKNKDIKGLYLHGSFGSGKTYLIAALLNELSKNRVRCEIVYFPELIREIKADFDSYGDRLNYLMDVDILLLDDMGAEKVTEWSRDEVLGTILQKRMEDHLPTFFTSNLSIQDLETHLAGSANSVDTVKSRRIIQRIKQLAEEIELVSENRRK